MEQWNIKVRIQLKKHNKPAKLKKGKEYRIQCSNVPIV